jgi:hypothetical protein
MDSLRQSMGGWWQGLLLLCSIPLAVVVLSVAAFWLLTPRVQHMGQELAAFAEAKTAGHWIRPSHVARPTPGTFAQAIEPLMPEVCRFYDQERVANPESLSSPRWNMVLDGQAPSRECLASLERARPLIRRLQQASWAQEGGLPEELWLFADPRPPGHDSGPLAVAMLVKFAAMEVRLQAEDGNADAALRLCLDGLGLSRDLGHDGGLLGDMMAGSMQETLFSPCQQALSRASAAEVHASIPGLRRLRESLPPLSSALKAERIFGLLYAFGRLLEPAQREALPAGMRAFMKQGEAFMEGPPLVSPLLSRFALVEFERFYEHAFVLVDLPPAVRRPQLRALEDKFNRSWNPVMHELPPELVAYSTRADVRRVQMDLLIAMALARAHRADQGVWPSALEPLHGEQKVLLPTALELQAAEAGALRIAPREEDLRQWEAGLDAEFWEGRPPLQAVVNP